MPLGTRGTSRASTLRGLSGCSHPLWGVLGLFWAWTHGGKCFAESFSLVPRGEGRVRGVQKWWAGSPVSEVLCFVRAAVVRRVVRGGCFCFILWVVNTARMSDERLWKPPTPCCIAAAYFDQLYFKRDRRCGVRSQLLWKMGKLALPTFCLGTNLLSTRQKIALNVKDREGLQRSVWLICDCSSGANPVLCWTCWWVMRAPRAPVPIYKSVLQHVPVRQIVGINPVTVRCYGVMGQEPFRNHRSM